MKGKAELYKVLFTAPQRATGQYRVLWWICAILLVLLPVSIPLVAFNYILGVPFHQMIPTLNDSVVYWHSTGTFIESGFNGGYYVYNEVPASEVTYHFGAWGPAYIMVYGAIGSFFGWTLVTPIYINMFFVMAALMIAIAISRPSLRQIAVLLLLLTTFWHLQIYIPAILQESINAANAIVLGALFYVLLKSGRPTAELVLATGMAIFWAAFFRFSWSILFIPYLVIVMQGKHSLLAVLIGSALSFLCFYLFSVYSAPYPSNAVGIIRESSPLLAIRTLMGLTYFNFLQLFKGTLLDYAMRLIVGAPAAYLVIRAFRQIWQDYTLSRDISLDVINPHQWLHLANLAGIFGLIFLYRVFPTVDYRILWPHLLLSLIVLILRNEFRPSVVVIALNWLLLVPSILFFFAFFSPTLTLHQKDLREFRSIIDPFIQYEPDQSPWCNTILVDQYPPELQAIPFGIGISGILGIEPESIPSPLKSQYILLNGEYRQELLDRGQLVFLTSTSAGDLYRNLESPCEALK